MTTAARPTWDTARGGRGKGEGDLSALSKQYSSRDLPAHTKLKYRQEGQGTTEELRGRDFRRELESGERAAREKRDKHRGDSSSSSSKRVRLEQIPAANLDADDPLDDDDEDEEENSDDEDDTAELLAELQKIKKERAAEKARMETERKAEEERIRTENILKGNPLLGQVGAGQDKSEFKVKRRMVSQHIAKAFALHHIDWALHRRVIPNRCLRAYTQSLHTSEVLKCVWDDDVVFKNCAKGDEARKSRGFINDTLRSEFHKKFMEKYVK